MQDTPPAATTTGALILACGTVFTGQGWGKTGTAVAEVCFNTAITGHFEILTDPSYAEQIVCFTSPHVGNVGIATADAQSDTKPVAKGAITRAPITPPSSWRAEHNFADHLANRHVIGLSGIDTRALTRHIRETGMPHGVIAHAPDGQFDIPALQDMAKKWAGIVGKDLAKPASTTTPQPHDTSLWTWPGERPKAAQSDAAQSNDTKVQSPHIVVIDFGTKTDILDNLAAASATVTSVPDTLNWDDIAALTPDGIVLSNGPGDPQATHARVRDLVAGVLASGIPTLGICLGHQILALASGASTTKMDQGHHGANHPVKDLATGRVEIVSMNHGFVVDRTTLPDGVQESHVSLFDGTNCGLTWTNAPITSVQHHPEAAPGPRDAAGVFTQFLDQVRLHKTT